VKRKLNDESIGHSYHAMGTSWRETYIIHGVCRLETIGIRTFSKQEQLAQHGYEYSFQTDLGMVEANT